MTKREALYERLCEQRRALRERPDDGLELVAAAALEGGDAAKAAAEHRAATDARDLAERAIDAALLRLGAEVAQEAAEGRDVHTAAYDAAGRRRRAEIAIERAQRALDGVPQLAAQLGIEPEATTRMAAERRRDVEAAEAALQAVPLPPVNARSPGCRAL